LGKCINPVVDTTAASYAEDTKQYINLEDAIQSSTYSSSDPAENAIDGNPNTFTHTKYAQVGEYWESSFVGGESSVTLVTI
jgi:hypothetical protein